MKRCSWTGNDKLMIKYHDEEWGIPIHKERKLFELLILESAQAGLSWRTILHKREGYKKLFDNFDYKKIAKYDENKIENLMQNPKIIRNRLKINSAIINAKVFIKIQKEFGSFDKYIWAFVNNKSIINNFRTIKELPAKTELSNKICKDMKKRGFKFIGSTIIYAYMQAIGMINNHLINCFKK